MWPEASFLTVSDRCALTELSVRDTSGNWRKTLHSTGTILNVSLHFISLRLLEIGHSIECCKHFPLVCDNVTVSVSYSLAVIC